MKHCINLLFIILLSYSVMAQEETLISGEIDHGGYGGFITKLGQINGEFGVFLGGQGAWIINHRVGLGAKGYFLVNKVEVEELQNIKLEFGCWGGLVEYIIASDKRVHANINLMIGAGSVHYTVADYQNDHSEIDYSDDGFFAMEPAVDLVLNVHKNIRIGIGAAYRIVNGVDYMSLSNSDLNGFSGEIVLMFGAF